MKSLIVLLSAFSMQALATPTLTNVTDDELTKIAKEASANFTHNSMMGASKLGSIFGFQLGLVGARTATPETDDIVRRNSGADLPNLYNAGIMGAVGVPFGVSVEAVLVPKITASGTDISATSLGLKWNINDVVPVLPVNVALRGVYSTAKFSFNQEISGQNATVENKTTVTGAQLLVSPMFPIVEPYVGIGVLNGSNELAVTGTTGTVFDPSYSVSQSESKSVSGTQFLAGVEANLLVMKLGAEYSQAFGTNRFGVKLAFGF